MRLKTKTISVSGFHCTGCADNLGTALQSLEGVVRADVDYEQGLVEVRFHAERVTDRDIRDRIRTAGFDPGEE